MSKYFSELKAHRTVVDHHDFFVREIPVIGTAHLPREELTHIIEWSTEDPGVAFFTRTPNNWKCVFRTELEEDDQAHLTEHGGPVLVSILRQCAEKGFQYAEFNPVGDEFDDLPTFEEP